MTRAEVQCYRTFITALVFFGAFGAQSAWAATAAGTSITNSMTVNYQDAATNNYSTTSNTVTTVVSNVPVMTITPPVAQSVTLGAIMVDTYTFTNTGNGSGNFQIPADATVLGTATGTTFNGYVLQAAPTGTCSVQTPCSLGILETQMAGLTATIAGGTITVGVEYTVSTSASVTQTIITSITANINYPVAGGVAQALASNVTSTQTDTIVTNARLDIQSTVIAPGSSGANITWAALVNNGGGVAANDSLAVGGTSTNVNGVFITVLLPKFAGTTLALISNPTCALSGANTGATAVVYYSVAAGWTTTPPAPLSNTVWVACLIKSGTGGMELPSATGGSTGVGNVTVPQVTLTYVTAQPTGVGSGNAPSVTSIANACWAGQIWATGTEYVIGPTIPAFTVDSGGYGLGTQEANVTPSVTTTPPGGASNVIGTAAFASLSFTLGPNPVASATGAWNAAIVPGYTSGTADTSRDFTFLDFDSSAIAVNSATSSAGAPSGSSIATGGTAVTILGEIINTGNVDDVYDLSNNTIGTWTVAYYFADCVTPLPSGFKRSVISGGNFAHCVKFTPPANVTAYSAIDFTITALSEWNSATNTTHDILYPGGVLVAFRSYAVSLCPGGVTPANNGVIPGCTITYTVTLVNEAPIVAAGSGANNVSVTPTSSAVITENAAATGNNWGTYTNGLKAVPTFISCTGCTTTGIATSKNFTVTIPTTDLAPQSTATYSYAVVVN